MNIQRFGIFTSFFTAAFFSAEASAIYVGTGFSTVTDGRAVPALQAGIDIGKSATLSGMMGGVRTTAYYSTAYQLNLMWGDNWGKFWGGDLDVAAGAGVYCGRKGIYTELDDAGEPSKLKSHDDIGVGPAFRVSYRPFSHLYIGVEYMFGINWGLIELGVANTGMGAIGMEF